MSLQKKIILSFLISSTLIAILAIFAYVNFIEVRKEIRNLELSDTLRSKTLQLRRHEKNFLLYRDVKEIQSVHNYISEIRGILVKNKGLDAGGRISNLQGKIEDYSQRFNRIESLAWEFLDNIASLKKSHPQYTVFFPLMESTFLESPEVNADQIRLLFRVKPGSPILFSLKELNTEITSLRKIGEEILILSKDLDTVAREKADRTIRISQTALLILFPLFLIVGFTALFVIVRSAVSQLKVIANAIEKTGKGDFTVLPAPSKHDEVGMLIEAFNRMERDLIERDKEIARKNDELLQGRKLASIGTLASGVAHELNNPLNNIYLAAQILTKEIQDDHFPDIVKETVNDIFSQTLRVKRIVGDLLEFARNKPPVFQNILIAPLLQDILAGLSASGDMEGISLQIAAPGDIEVKADRHLMEQLFINLITNAMHAMAGKGSLNIALSRQDGVVSIEITDTGPGIPDKDLSRIFDPFFTTKEKGTGLGLAIVYNIVQKHFGKITVRSAQGKGTTFTIQLPEE
ncbi:MAG: HAMP domain-containing protein [Nitrospirae bacterium]|nr:HAMP domain-containing protein [Nitrospirota bacterium]